MPIGQLTPIPLREVWAHKAYDFTVWLSQNLSYLDERLNTELTLTGREIPAGAFSADILFEDVHGNVVLIENQLSRTDLDHLGKLITYMSNLDAKNAIWVTSEPRSEHETAVHWLNELLPADTSFYLIKTEAFRIGESPPAPPLHYRCRPHTRRPAGRRYQKAVGGDRSLSPRILAAITRAIEQENALTCQHLAGKGTLDWRRRSEQSNTPVRAESSRL